MKPLPAVALLHFCKGAWEEVFIINLQLFFLPLSSWALLVKLFS